MRYFIETVVYNTTARIYSYDYNTHTVDITGDVIKIFRKEFGLVAIFNSRNYNLEVR